jgi:hypothetical protein
MRPMPRSDRLTGEAAHDVLAAEEFGVPAPDPSLHHGPITLPADPSGIVEPHDVLAAEEFAMPAPLPGRYGATRPRQPSLQTSLIAVVASLAVLWVARRLLRR